jgi:hypothetical protein
VTSVILGGRPAGILIFGDDGVGLKRKPGHYIFLRFEGQVSFIGLQISGGLSVNY